MLTGNDFLYSLIFNPIPYKLSINNYNQFLFCTLILRSEMKSASKLFGVPSEHFVAFFISLRSYYEEPSRTPKE